MWSAFMAQALPEVPTSTFAQPDPVAATKPILDGNYIINNQVHTILYYIDKNDPLGPAPADPISDPQFHNWEVGVQNWWAGNGSSVSTPANVNM
jgi:hypothetical protein